ncbi:MAG: TadE/TadG family type IV pilus assembly protein [Xanthobacteraceae bacterium]
MSVAALLRGIAGLPRQLGRDASASAAVEFALIVPVMLTIYIGGSTVTQGISIDRKVTLVAHAVSDLTAQASSLTNTEISNILDAASAIITPYSSAPMSVTVTSIKIDSNKKATVIWSKTLNGTQRSGDVTGKIPADLKEAESCLIWGEATYVFKPAIGYVISGSINLGDETFMRPRQAAYSACVAKT